MSGNENNLAPTTPEEREYFQRVFRHADENWPEHLTETQYARIGLRLLADVDRRDEQIAKLTAELDAARKEANELGDELVQPLLDHARAEMRERCKQKAKSMHWAYGDTVADAIASLPLEKASGG